MFARRAKPPPPAQPPAEETGTAAPAGPDPRDEIIERLERDLVEQRAAAQSLREALDAATFKMEVLEKSYAKQLADTRGKLAATEQSLADKQGVLAALDGGHENALRALNDARAEIKLLSAERDQLRKEIAQGGFRERGVPAARTPLAADDPTDAGGTINQLIANTSWAEKKPSAAGAGAASAAAAEPEGPREDMLAPELVFANNKDEDEER